MTAPISIDPFAGSTRISDSTPAARPPTSTAYDTHSGSSTIPETSPATSTGPSGRPIGR